MNRREFHHATLAALLTGTADLPTAAAPEPEPLPVGIVARLGDNRFWHIPSRGDPGFKSLAFAPDRFRTLYKSEHQNAPKITQPS
jgi:hypothetical protein